MLQFSVTIKVYCSMFCIVKFNILIAMVVITHFVFFVTLANYCFCQVDDVSENVTSKSIEEFVTLTTTESAKDHKSINLSLSDTKQELSSESETNVSISWNDFMNILTSVSLDQLNKTKNNIKSCYHFNEMEINNVEKVFNITDSEYEYLLLYRLKQLIEDNKFNESEEFMLHFLDQSNLLIEKILEHNLAKLDNPSLQSLTKWHQQTLKDKIFRQQVKTSKTIVEMQICNMLAICKEKEHYSGYIIEWVRCLLNDNDFTVNKVFNAVPVVVDRYAGFIKSNALFKKNMQYASKSEPSAQRDVLDFIDETITNENVFILIPNALKKCAVLLIQLLNVVNEVYDLNDENYEDLENISNMFMYREGNVKDILDAVIKNMQINFKGWPKEKQAEVNRIWSAITVL